MESYVVDNGALENQTSTLEGKMKCNVKQVITDAGVTVREKERRG